MYIGRFRNVVRFTYLTHLLDINTTLHQTYTIHGLLDKVIDVYRGFGH